MSDEVVIWVENLGKCYHIQHQAQRQRYTALRDVLADKTKSLARRLWSLTARTPHSALRTPHSEDFWALKDVSFEVKQGDVLGIIGRNGAGKSTLLKILSRITEPTEGRVRIKGRVASLLEVGTGFHPELTGRENIFLNGAILGMTREEIKRKFDEIVAFAEVEKFLDTPVKRYSSGMYVRLAFAVAAHLEPDLLIVDEVLAVGDAAFQKKCLGKMQDVSKGGRTILFVSHNMGALKSLCTAAIELQAGRLTAKGETAKVVGNYLASIRSIQMDDLEKRKDRSGDGSARITSIKIQTADDIGIIQSRSRLKFTIQYRSQKPLKNATFLVGVYDYSNTGLFLLNSEVIGCLPKTLPAQGTVTSVTEAINLTPGACFVNIAMLTDGATVDYIQHASSFEVAGGDPEWAGKEPTRDWVVGLLKHRWELVRNDTPA